MTRKDNRYLNAERRLRHSRWEHNRCGLDVWGKVVAVVAALALSAFVIMPLIKMWLD